MTVATPIEIRQLGLANESVRGTVPAAPAYFLSVTKDSEIEYATKLVEDPALRGVNARYPSFPGAQEAKGPLKTPVRAQNMGEFLYMLFGAPTTAEQASFVVTTGANDTIDFNIGGGNLVATLAAGTYVAGQTQADAGSLCALVKNALAAAEGAGVYTVSYSRTTGLFTIARSAGTFQMKFLTGPNTAKNAAALLGFAVADQTGSLSYAGTVVQAPPFKHTFNSAGLVQPPSYSFYLNRGISKKSYNLGTLAKLKISGAQTGPVELEGTVMAQQEAAYGGAWNPVYSESPVLMFQHTTVKVAGSAAAVPNVASWDVEFDPIIKAYRPLSQTQYPQDFLASGPFTVQGNMVVYFQDETERNKFIAVTTTSLEFLIAGSVVAGGTVKYTLDLLMSAVEYEAFPFQDEGGFLGAKVKWRARYNVGTSLLTQCYVINSRTAYP